MEENVMIIKNKDGSEERYEIVLAYTSLKNNNNYIIFTDNKEDLEGNTNLYAKRYNKETDRFEDINDEEEWNDVKEKIDNLLVNGGEDNA